VDTNRKVIAVLKFITYHAFIVINKSDKTKRRVSCIKVIERRNSGDNLQCPPSFIFFIVYGEANKNYREVIFPFGGSFCAHHSLIQIPKTGTLSDVS
jgi:hypothetical protein